MTPFTAAEGKRDPLARSGLGRWLSYDVDEVDPFSDFFIRRDLGEANFGQRGIKYATFDARLKPKLNRLSE